MLEIRKDAAKHILDELRTSQSPALDDTLAQVQAAAASIGAAGKAEFAGESLEGPDLVAAWGLAWRKLHAATLRARAIDWARGQGRGVAPPSELDQLESAWASFDKGMAPAIAGVIAADAARVTPDAARALYARYVAVLGSLAPQVADQQALLAAVQPALQQLADKSPDLASQVQAYERATGELLRWRARAAAAHARRMVKEAKPVAEVLAAAAGDAEVQGRLKRANARLELTWIGTPTPATMRDLARLLPAQPVTLAELAPLEDGAAANRWRDRQFARIADAKLPATAIANLKADLLVTQNAPALSLPAAIAIASAEQGYLAAAGGKITGAQADGLLVHLITLGDAPAHLPIGTMPEETPADAINRLVLTVQVKPGWLQHEHVFVELP
jgi:hypothetical protein